MNVPFTHIMPTVAETLEARTSFAPCPRRRNAFRDNGVAEEDSIENLAPAATSTSRTFGNAASPVRRNVPRLTEMEPVVVLERFVTVKVKSPTGSHTSETMFCTMNVDRESAVAFMVSVAGYRALVPSAYAADVM